MFCKFTKQLMYLKGAPASSAALFFGVVCLWGLVQQEDAWLGQLCPFLASYRHFASFADTKINIQLVCNGKQDKFVFWKL